MLTTAQLTTLKAAILADADPAVVTARTNGADNELARLYNLTAAPSFTVWKSGVSIAETGGAFNGSEWAGMTSGNHTRLQTVAQYLSNYSPADADIRAMFDDIWSGAGGTTTRANLLALWKRLATKAEKALATGTGSDAVPAVMGFEGQLTSDDISAAMRS